LEPLIREDFLNIYKEAARISRKGVCHPRHAGVGGWQFPKGELKGFDKNLWRKGRFFIGGSELEKKVLSEGRSVEREETKNIGF